MVTRTTWDFSKGACDEYAKRATAGIVDGRTAVAAAAEPVSTKAVAH
jgi:hypothetical protein